MDFGIRIYRTIHVTDDLYFHITETLVVSWIIIAILIALAIVVRVKSSKWDVTNKPTGLQNVVEMAVDAFENFFASSASSKVSYLAPWFFTVFVFIAFANMTGVVGLRPPTADWGVTFPLAMSSLVLFQYAGLRYRPKNYIRGFFQPIFLFLPINLLGELAKPVALSFRLFGNVLGGVILISILYGMAPFILRIGFPAFLHAYFDIAVGVLQAFIFCVLSITFVGLAAEEA